MCYFLTAIMLEYKSNHSSFDKDVDQANVLKKLVYEGDSNTNRCCYKN